MIVTGPTVVSIFFVHTSHMMWSSAGWSDSISNLHFGLNSTVYDSAYDLSFYDFLIRIHGLQVIACWCIVVIGKCIRTIV